MNTRLNVVVKRGEQWTERC